MEVRQHFLLEQEFPMCNFFGHWRPTKPFMGSLQRAFSCGCLWWNQQIISVTVSSTLTGTGANYSLNWPASLELSVSRWCQLAMFCIIYNGPWIQFNTFPRNKRFLVQKSMADLSAWTSFKRNIQNIEGWAEQVRAKVERKGKLRLNTAMLQNVCLGLPG